MKQRQQFEKSIRIAALLTLALIVAKCHAQEFRVETGERAFLEMRTITNRFNQ